jgi:hypothetical protein
MVSVALAGDIGAAVGRTSLPMVASTAPILKQERERSSANVPESFGVWSRHSLASFGPNEGLSASVHPGKTATPAKVLRATGRYSMRRADVGSTTTSRSYTQKSLKAAEPPLDVLKLRLRREVVSYAKRMREKGLLPY